MLIILIILIFLIALGVAIEALILFVWSKILYEFREQSDILRGIQARISQSSRGAYESVSDKDMSQRE